MARRRIGQERFSFSSARKRNDLEVLSGLLDWTEIDRYFVDISSASKGEAGWPPLALFKAMVLASWYDLSDVKLAEALDDRGSFRQFCGFSGHEATPERTTFVRFRKILAERDLMAILFMVVSDQLTARHIEVKTGTLVDATIIASASKGDDEARFVKHRGKKAVHGYKAHVAADKDSDLIEELAVTTANVNDGKAGCMIIPDDPGEVFADSAYRGQRFAQAVMDKGGLARVVQIGVWARDEAQAKKQLAQINGPIHRVRPRIEKIFGTWKRSYGLRRMRFMGLAKASLQIHFGAIAYNLKRSLSLAAAGR